MLQQRPSPRWQRLALVALAVAALPLLTTWNWWSPAPAARTTFNDLAHSYTPPGGVWERSDEIVVDFRDNAPADTIAALGSRFGLHYLSGAVDSNPARILTAQVDPSRAPALLEQLRHDPNVEAAEPLRYVTAFWKPNDDRYKEQWNFQLINMEKAWDTTRGKGVVVAVIDTGCALESDRKCYQARDFKETRTEKGYDFIARDDHPKDDNGHGTHVAGTIAESTNNKEGVAGIAFEARVMGLKVLTADGWGTTADIAEAIRYAADHGAQIINMSLGGPMPDQVMHSACQYAYRKGVTIVCAAGNSGREGVGYPAAFKECIAVSAVGPTGELSFYSSWGKEICIAAPGGDKSKSEADGVLQNTVINGNDGYYQFQGTSMASPHVAGVAALIASRGVTDPPAVRQVLEKSAKKKEPKNKYGAGILDAAAAVQSADETAREPAARFEFALLLGALGLGLAAYRSRWAGRRALPLAGTLVFLLGMALPEGLSSLVGSESPLNVLGHSALLPMALLALGLADRRWLGFVAALAAGFAAHLAWDGARSVAPFSYEAGWRAMPWLWVNLAVATSVALTAFRRGAQPE